MRPKGGKETGPNCFQCRHLTITWDESRPYACLGMGFKSHRIPSQVVKSASGSACLMFSPKPPRK
ncbi:MAG: uracil-DNA glycosylase [Desulfarculaceae bacterium]|jgi:hypothetical protein